MKDNICYLWFCEQILLFIFIFHYNLNEIVRVDFENVHLL